MPLTRTSRSTRPRRSSRVRAFLTRTNAATAVEFAIILPILLTIVFAIIDFGRGLWTINVATSALREGARLAAAQVGGTATCTTAANTAPARVASYLASTGMTAVAAQAKCDNTNSYIYVCFGGGSTDCTGNTNTAMPGKFPFKPIAKMLSKLVLPSDSVRVPTAVFRWEQAG